MSFRGLFIAVLLSTAMLVSAFAINRQRPAVEVNKPTPTLIRATGKCADCHRHETSAVVHEFEMSKHSEVGLTCLECHQPADGQENYDHKGFIITRTVTAANCKKCHATEYEQYLKSRHAAPAWAAVSGTADFTPEQIAFAEKYHKGAVDRPPHDLVAVQGPQSITKGCQKCHDVGRPNPDGTIGSCTSCHARHVSSVELARQPETCGQCHMGPDHAQLEIYHESKHGVLFNAQKAHMNMAADPKKLTAADMPVPTCATCHMSGLNSEKPGEKLTHDVGERLSYYLFAPVSERRPNFRSKQTAMKSMCLECHTNPRIIKFYNEAEGVVRSTNKLVKEAEDIMKELRSKNLLTPEPFDEPIEYTYFDLWHYGGRTAKHGAFMGGADFVQWHGYYEVVSKMTELKHAAEELKKGQPPSDPTAAFAKEPKPEAPAAAPDDQAPLETEATTSPSAPSGYPKRPEP